MQQASKIVITFWRKSINPKPSSPKEIEIYKFLHTTPRDDNRYFAMALRNSKKI